MFQPDLQPGASLLRHQFFSLSQLAILPRQNHSAGELLRHRCRQYVGRRPEQHTWPRCHKSINIYGPNSQGELPLTVTTDQGAHCLSSHLHQWEAPRNRPIQQATYINEKLPQNRPIQQATYINGKDIKFPNWTPTLVLPLQNTWFKEKWFSDRLLFWSLIPTRINQIRFDSYFNNTFT